MFRDQLLLRAMSSPEGSGNCQVRPASVSADQRCPGGQVSRRQVQGAKCSKAGSLLPEALLISACIGTITRLAAMGEEREHKRDKQDKRHHKEHKSSKDKDRDRDRKHRDRAAEDGDRHKASARSDCRPREDRPSGADGKRKADQEAPSPAKRPKLADSEPAAQQPAGQRTACHRLRPARQRARYCHRRQQQPMAHGRQQAALQSRSLAARCP